MGCRPSHLRTLMSHILSERSWRNKEMPVWDENCIYRELEVTVTIISDFCIIFPVFYHKLFCSNQVYKKQNVEFSPQIDFSLFAETLQIRYEAFVNMGWTDSPRMCPFTFLKNSLEFFFF